MNIHLQPLFLILCATTAMAQTQIATTNTDNVEKSTNLVRAASGYVLDDTHQLEPGDKISFQIIEDKKPLINLIVTDSTELDVPYIGRVVVAGKTCQQLAAELKVLLEKDYYYHATVVIGLDSVDKVRGQAFLYGQVRSQGAIDILFNHNLTAGEAIVRAGGFGDFADKKSVKVIRNRDSKDAKKKVFEINMVDVLEKGKIEKDVILEPGDFIIIPTRMINF
jgi:protein involved in polysaccharide export with SLBB domain